MLNELMELKGTKNIRDLGGIPAAGGKTLKRGKIIRSGRLSNLPPETVEALCGLGIDNIVDLRSDREIAEHPPTILRGAGYHYLNLIPTAYPELTNARHMSTEMYAQSKHAKKKFGSYEGYMHAMYKHIVTDEESRKKLKKVFDLLVSEENCILYHCNSGTDRTGIITMLLLSVLGVPEEEIVRDYMLSRRYQRRRRYWQKFALIIAPVDLRFKHLLYAQMLPKPQYISHLMEEIKEEYGSVESYVKGLGVTDGEIEILKDKYLE